MTKFLFFSIDNSFYNCWENETGLDLFCWLVDSWITNILIAMVAFVIAQLLTAGIAAGAVSLGAEALAAAAEAELVSAIVAALIFDANGIVLSFTDFRLRFCETATGG